MIVWLASYPRSGNTLFRIALHSLYGIKTYSAHDDADIEGMGAAEAVGHETLPAPLEELARQPTIFLVKTHFLPTTDYPAIYLVRDGRDTLVSYARYIRSFPGRTGPLVQLRKMIGLPNFRRALKQLIVTDGNGRWNSRGVLSCGWSHHVLDWTRRRSNGPTVVVRYEDLTEEPQLWVDRALEALRVPVARKRDGAMPAFDALHEQWPQFFRKGQSGGWRNELPEDLHRLFWQYHAEAMRAFNYEPNPFSM